METPFIVFSESIQPANAFALEITTERQDRNPVTTYVAADRADFDAKRLSAMFPDATIKLTKMARIKAVYKKGIRTKLNDYKDFYDGLTDDQYKSTLIQDAKTAQMV